MALISSISHSRGGTPKLLANSFQVTTASGVLRGALSISAYIPPPAQMTASTSVVSAAAISWLACIRANRKAIAPTRA